MTAPEILALDFDGVLCDGMAEYFEASRRTCRRVWPDEAAPGEDLLPSFRALRPVIMSGWEMPVLLRAIMQGATRSVIFENWAAVRDELVKAGGKLRGEELVADLQRTLDEVRREWIAADREDWLARNVPYCRPDELRSLVREPERAFVVTTKEGEFARQILDHWDVRVDGIHGKEAGIHKCDNLRVLIVDFMSNRGRRPTLWFVEDRLETLRHVSRHSDLDDVELYLADWGYNTPETRAEAGSDPRVHLLGLDRFRRGVATWL